MNAEASPLLEQLRDIHTVSEPSWWPPAPAWWVLAFLAFLLIAWLMQRVLERRAMGRRKRAWLALLDNIGDDEFAAEHPRQWLSELSRLFRAIALKAFPSTRCARLEGEEWVAFIRSMLPEEAPAEALSALARGPWQTDPEFDSKALREAARWWVKRYG